VNQSPDRSSTSDALARWIASLGPTGFAPLVPATVASLLVAVVYAFLPPLGLTVDIVATTLLVPLAVWAAGRAERSWGHDARRIVIDEVVGMAATLFWLPAGLEVAIAGFFAFRFFDILKPFPVSRAERLPGGYGVVADDLLAGIYANLALRALALLGGVLLAP
jgi:phosphatidylglycerophosphatase A